MFIDNMTLADKIVLRLLQTKNYLTFENLKCAEKSKSEILLFSIKRHRTTKDIKEYYASYNTSSYIFSLNAKRYITYKELLEDAWDL